MFLPMLPRLIIPTPYTYLPSPYINTTEPFPYPPRSLRPPLTQPLSLRRRTADVDEHLFPPLIDNDSQSSFSTGLP